jgi:hypothetical protein
LNGLKKALQDLSQMSGKRAAAHNRQEDPVSLPVKSAEIEAQEMRLDDALVLE